MNADEILKLLRNKYDFAKGYVFMEQVPNLTGGSQDRHVDAVVFSTWKSVGIGRYAFEVKTSRNDFIRELQTPGKYDWCLKYFNEFWYVAPKDVIKIEELPAGVGWLYPTSSDDSLYIARHASFNKDAQLDNNLLSVLMYSAFLTIERVKKTAVKEYVDEDPEYRKTMAYATAAKQYLNSGDFQVRQYVPWETEDPEVILKYLQEHDMDETTKKQRMQILELLRHYQDEMKDYFSLFSVLAHESLLATDEAGKFLVKAWGGNDSLTIKRQKGYYLNEETKDKLKILNIIREIDVLPAKNKKKKEQT